MGVARALEEIFNLVRHYHDQNKKEEEEEEGTEVGTEEGTEVETGNYFFLPFYESAHTHSVKLNLTLY